MAAATVSVIPVLVVYLFAQKYFIQGITMTGLKG
jgi:ABC-type glycerol-3-phosphate transport system permease component